MNRRSFIKNTALLAVGTAVAAERPVMGAVKTGTTGTDAVRAAEVGSSASGKLSLDWENFTAQMKYTFTISGSSRTSTPIVLTRITWDGVTGYGEASMPPYLGETHETADLFLKRVKEEVLPRFDDPFRTEEILRETDDIAEGNNAAKASVDIALHDLTGKLLGQPWWRIWGYDPSRAPYTCFTIGYDESDDVVRRKTREASDSHFLKVKLGQDDARDRRMIRLIREVCPGTPLFIDANQGWKDRVYASEMAGWLAEQGAVLIEQPMNRSDIEGNGYVTSRSPIPVVADESCRRLKDIRNIYGAFNAINIKLMKCTGLREGHEMITLAHSLGLETMIGCMTETSVAISAAAQLSPKMKWADLDGNILISNDPFSGMKLRDGRITLTAAPGIGITGKRQLPGSEQA